MRALLAIAGASVREHVRRKLLLFFVVLAVAVALGLIYLSLNRDVTSSMLGAAVGLATLASLGLLSGLATLATVAVSMNNIGRPFSDGEALLILSRPISRRQYALGRLLASVGVVIGLCVVMAVLMQAVGLFEQRGTGAVLWGHWATTAFNLSLLAAITTMMSALVDTPLLAAFISYFLYSSTGIVTALYRLVEAGRMAGLPAAVIRTAWLVTPKTLISPLAARMLPEGADAGTGRISGLAATSRVVWSAGYLTVVLGLTFFLAGRKDL